MDLCKSFANNKDECYAHISDEERDVLRNEGTHTNHPTHTQTHSPHTHTSVHTPPHVHTLMYQMKLYAAGKSRILSSAYTNYFSPHARSDRAVHTGTILRHSQYSPSSSPLPTLPSSLSFPLVPFLPSISPSTSLPLFSSTSPFLYYTIQFKKPRLG
jgi:hypothetical protein